MVTACGMSATVQLVHENARHPTLGTEGAAGYDVHAAESYIVEPNQTVCVDTGVRVKMGTCYGRLADRSSVAVRKNLVVTEGIVPAGFDGILVVPMYNFGEEIRRIDAGDRVAQLIFEKDHYSSSGLFSSRRYLIRPGEMVRVTTGFEPAVAMTDDSSLWLMDGIFDDRRLLVLEEEEEGAAWEDGGEVRVPVYNYGAQDRVVEPGDRVASMRLQRSATKVELVRADSLEPTVRDCSSFGSTGV
jgi:deoxyuridine 5'-triphosphate nucleotidohydrolase